MEILDFIKTLQVPGLILAGIVIYLMYKILMAQLDRNSQLANQLLENNATLREMNALISQVCQKVGVYTGGRP